MRNFEILQDMKVLALFGGQARHWDGFLTMRGACYKVWQFVTSETEGSLAHGWLWPFQVLTMFPSSSFSCKTFTCFYLNIFYSSIIFLKIRIWMLAYMPV